MKIQHAAEPVRFAQSLSNTRSAAVTNDTTGGHINIYQYLTTWNKTPLCNVKVNIRQTIYQLEKCVTGTLQSCSVSFELILPSKPQSFDAPAAEIFVSETRFRWSAEAEGRLSLPGRPYFAKNTSQAQYCSVYECLMALLLTFTCMYGRRGTRK